MNGIEKNFPIFQLSLSWAVFHFYIFLKKRTKQVNNIAATSATDLTLYQPTPCTLETNLTAFILKMRALYFTLLILSLSTISSSKSSFDL